MPGTRSTSQLPGGGVSVQLDHTLTAIGVTDWVLLASRVQVQVTGAATAVTVQLERSTVDPVGTANPAPVGAAASGNPSTGMAVLSSEEAGAAWWRARVTALTGASVSLAITGRGAATPASIVQDRTASPKLARLRLSLLQGSAGAIFSAEVQGKTAGTELRLSRNPGERWKLTGTTLVGSGLKRGVEQPAIVELPGTSGALAARETEFDIQVSHELPIVTLTGDGPKTEGNSGARIYVFTVTRSSSNGPVSVPWTFAAGATNAADYTGGVLPSGGFVTMANGVSSGTYTISVNGDTSVEPDEAATTSISAPSGYAAGGSMSAPVTILNDDGLVLAALSISTPALRATMQPKDVVATVGGKLVGSALMLSGAAFENARLALSDDETAIVVGQSGAGVDGETTGAFSLAEINGGAVNSGLITSFGAISTVQRFYPLRSGTTGVARSYASPGPPSAPGGAARNAVIILGYFRVEATPASNRTLVGYVSTGGTGSGVPPRLYLTSSGTLQVQCWNASAYTRTIGKIEPFKWYYVAAHINPTTGYVNGWLDEVAATGAATMGSSITLPDAQFAGFELGASTSPVHAQFGYWWAWDGATVGPIDFGTQENYLVRQLAAMDVPGDGALTFRKVDGNQVTLTPSRYYQGGKAADFNGGATIPNLGSAGGALYRWAGTWANGAAAAVQPLAFTSDVFALADPAAQPAATSLQDGLVTFNLSAAKTWGRFWDYSIWVKNDGGSPAAVVTMLPPATNGVRPIGSGGYTAALDYHGAMIDPGNNVDAVAHPVGGSNPPNIDGSLQGWDAYAAPQSGYFAGFNVDPAKTGSAVGGAENSLVKVVSRTANLPSGDPINMATDIRVLTRLNGQPPNTTEGWFRPGISRPAKDLWIKAFTNTDPALDTAIDLSAFPAIATTGLTLIPPGATAFSWFNMIQDNWIMNHQTGKNIIVAEQANYGREFAQRTGTAALMLMLPESTVSLSWKKNIARGFIKQAIDLTAAFEEGRRMSGGGLGNTSTGRKLMLAVAAVITGNARILAAAQTLNWLADDQHFGLIGDAQILRASNPFAESWRGKGWWSSSPFSNGYGPVPMWYGARRGRGGGSSWPDGSPVLGGSGDNDNGAEYRHNSCSALFMTYVVMKLCPALAVAYNNPAFMAALETYYQIEAGLAPRPNGVLVTSYGSAFDGDGTDSLNQAGNNVNSKVLRQRSDLASYFA